jgi:hypothetical protein
MVTWSEFEAAAPELARRGRERFDATGLALVGSLRKDGWPRISPVEPFVYDGDIWLGMMWRSMKALDLRRDDRCVVHSTVADKDGTEGEFKLYGRAVEVHDREVRDGYCEVLKEAIGWAPEGDEWHLFKLDIDEAVHQIFGGGNHRTTRWLPGSEPVTIEQPSP